MHRVLPFLVMAFVGLITLGWPEASASETETPIIVSGSRTYPGITITGVIGHTYRVVVFSDAGQTNTQILTNLVLPSSPYLWIDETGLETKQRLYRIVDTSTYEPLVKGLSIRMYTGLTIKGTVGTICVVNRTPISVHDTNHTVFSFGLTRSPYLWLDTKHPMSRPSDYVVTADPHPEKLVWIAPGVFEMGSRATEPLRNSDETLHTVILTNGFYMYKNLVTRGEFGALMDTTSDVSTRNFGLPVASVSWYDAADYCRRLTEQEVSEGHIPAGWVYRLPTEAEWEYACRGGTTTAFYFGNSIRAGDANFDSHKEYDALRGDVYNTAASPIFGRTTPVGGFPPNPFGLYDMCGNVWQWCQDWYGPYKASVAEVNPTGPATGGYRILRGGNYFQPGRDCRSASRDGAGPSDRGVGFGFRPVLAPN